MLTHRLGLFEEKQSEVINKYILASILNLKKSELSSKLMELLKENKLDVIEALIRIKCTFLSELNDEDGYLILKTILAQQKDFFDTEEKKKIEELLFTLVTFDKNKMAIVLLESVKNLFVSSTLVSTAASQKVCNMDLMKLLCRDNYFMFRETMTMPSALSAAIARGHEELVAFFVKERRHHLSNDQLKMTLTFFSSRNNKQSVDLLLMKRSDSLNHPPVLKFHVSG